MSSIAAEYKRYAQSNIMQILAATAHGDDYCGQTSSATFSQILECIAPLNLVQPKVLDLGCGAGTFAVQLAEHFKQCEIYGVDISEHMISEANNLATARKMQSACNFYVKDFTDTEMLSLLPARFELIASIGSLYWGVDLGSMLKIWSKLLNSEGHILIFANMQDIGLSLQQQANVAHTKFIEFSEFERALAQAGFKIKQGMADNQTYIQWLQKWNACLQHNFQALADDLGLEPAEKMRCRFSTYQELAETNKVIRRVLLINRAGA
jgi:cyclopropane fatty-acyl-phospholipid synthase-like methyltransferase